MLKSKEYYQNLLDKVEPMLETHIENMVADSSCKNPKTEEYVIALCNAKDYLIAKIAKITLNEAIELQRNISQTNTKMCTDICVEHEEKHIKREVVQDEG